MTDQSATDAAPDPDPVPDFDAVMRAARRWHYTEIRSIADEAIRECVAECPRGSERDRREWLTQWIEETTDGHQHVIMTAQAGMVLAASDNDDAHADEFGEDATADTSARACMAMRADVWEVVEARSDEWTPDESESDDDDDDDTAHARRSAHLSAVADE